MMGQQYRAWRLVAMAVAVLALPGAARAKIYTWRDAKGVLTLSDHRPAGYGVQTYPVAGSPTIRSTRRLVTEPAPGFDPLIQEHAAAYQVRPDLVRAVIQTESAFDVRARSVKGAMGLMQLMPATATQYGVADPYNPNENIRGGVAYLRDLLVKYNGNEELALAAYNAGPTAVDKYGEKVPPYRETENYVERVRAATALVSIAGPRIYRVVEVINGRTLIRYTTTKPSGRPHEVVSTRR